MDITTFSIIEIEKITTMLLALSSALFAGLSWWYIKLEYDRNNSKLITATF